MDERNGNIPFHAVHPLFYLGLGYFSKGITENEIQNPKPKIQNRN
jgi:hypothetical protein